MPKYEFDPSKVSASIEIFPKDTYEFIVGEPKSFKGQNKQGKDNYGVRYPLVIAEGDFKNKKTVVTLYMHSEGAQSMSKQFLMAALGYKNSQEAEQQFNEDMRGEDWSFDPEAGTVGEVWRRAAGKRMLGSLDVKKKEDSDDMQQDFKKWMPYTAE